MPSRRFGVQKYKLDRNGEPVPMDDVVGWANWFETADRHLGKAYVRDMFVSTVFLGIDHGWGEVPILWETMILGGPLDGYQVRYATRGDALAGHALALELARLCPPFDLGRNRVEMFGYRLVRRYRRRQKRWAVFDGTSREPVAYVIRIEDAPPQMRWFVVGRDRRFALQCGYISTGIQALRSDEIRERAQRLPVVH